MSLLESPYPLLLLLLSLFLSFSSTVILNNGSAQQNKVKQQRQLSLWPIFLYSPIHSIVDQAAIDLDQRDIENELQKVSIISTTGDGDDYGFETIMSHAWNLYSQGAHSKSYAILQLASPLTITMPKGAFVLGYNMEGEEIIGATLFKDAPVGSSRLEILYPINDDYNINNEISERHNDCQVGASMDPVLDGCFVPTGEVVVGNSRLTIAYSYDMLLDNLNGRTIRQFSLNAVTEIYSCNNPSQNTLCPNEEISKFHNYYGQFHYADTWVTSAFEGAETSFANGNIDFSRLSAVGRLKAASSGMVTMNVWMQVIGKMSNAIHDCYEYCSNDDVASASCIDTAQSWDEAVAYYTGSLQQYNDSPLDDHQSSSNSSTQASNSMEGEKEIVSYVMEPFETISDQWTTRVYDNQGELNLTLEEPGLFGERALRVEYQVAQSESWGGYVDFGWILNASEPATHNCLGATHLSFWYKVVKAPSVLGRLHLRLLLFDDSDCAVREDCYDDWRYETYYTFHYILGNDESSASGGGWTEVRIGLRGDDNPNSPFWLTGWTGIVGNKKLDLDRLRGWRIEISMDSQGDIGSQSDGIVLIDQLSCIGGGELLGAPFQVGDDETFYDTLVMGTWLAQEQYPPSSLDNNMSYCGLVDNGMLQVNYFLGPNEVFYYQHIAPGSAYYNLSLATNLSLDYKVINKTQSDFGSLHLRIILLDGSSNCNMLDCAVFPSDSIESYETSRYVFDSNDTSAKSGNIRASLHSKDGKSSSLLWQTASESHVMDVSQVKGYRFEFSVDSAGGSDADTIVSGVVAIGNLTTLAQSINISPAYDGEEGNGMNAGGGGGGGGGYLLYQLANDRCKNYFTCGPNGNQVIGDEAKINYDIFDQFVVGQHHLLSGNCDAMISTKQQIVWYMIVPLVQGLLRSAYLMSELGGGVRTEEVEAEGASYAAAILPLLHDCSMEDADYVYANMRVVVRQSDENSNIPLPDFRMIKQVLERNYNCLGITCRHVGGLVNLNPISFDAAPVGGSGSSTSPIDGPIYLDEAAPCSDGQDENNRPIPSDSPTWSSSPSTISSVSAADTLGKMISNNFKVTRTILLFILQQQRQQQQDNR